MIEEQFLFRQVETDDDYRQSPLPYMQREVLGWLNIFSSQMYACNCTLKRMTYKHEVKPLHPPAIDANAPLAHFYEIEALVSAETEEAMTCLKAMTKKETPA